MRTIVIAFIAGLVSTGRAQCVSPLFARGYTVSPAPQTVSLGDKDFRFDKSWQLKLGTGVDKDDVAVDALSEGLASRFNVQLAGRGKVSRSLWLRIEPGSVPIGKALDPDKKSLTEEAYRIDLHDGAVTITADAPTGLFYGVETFIQLLRPESGLLWLPEGMIEDWPDLQLRQIYWDDNHHLEKVDELKRALRQAAFYKINGFVLKLNGHFQYKSAPSVVEPYALTPAELQRLTDYGLRYHIQLIPYLDGPAHIAFILKHPEYARLREFPDSNYEICATNPDAYKLLEGMYDDLLDANRGVKYFYLSTDEAYYLGQAHNLQCNEEDLAKRMGSAGQVFSHFVDQAGGYLHDRGRTVMFWGEYPLKPSDIPSLPPYLINGEVYGPVFDKAFHQHGIRQMIFTSVETSRYPLFPNHSVLPQSQRLHATGATNELTDNVDSLTRSISFDDSRLNTSVIGEVDAGWGDEGANPEAFWLGYVASGSAAWHPGAVSAPELESTFYFLFYGPGILNMDRVYRLMSEQAQSWSDSWDSMPSTARKPIWGSSYEIFKTPHPAHDQTLPLPPSPTANLDYRSTWSSENARRLALASQTKRANAILLGLLFENLQRSKFNRYNLEVYVTIAELCRQNSAMILDIGQMDADLAAASQAKDTDPTEAILHLDKALDAATSIWQDRNKVLTNATATWYKKWFPRVAEANGRRFLNELDDVKDHLPNRTVDMSYLVYRETLLPFGDWVNSIAAVRNQFAAAHQLPQRKYHLSWEDFRVTPPWFAMELSSTAAHAAAQ